MYMLPGRGLYFNGGQVFLLVQDDIQALIQRIHHFKAQVSRYIQVDWCLLYKMHCIRIRLS